MPDRPGFAVDGELAVEVEDIEVLKLYAGAVLFRGPVGTRFARTEDQGRFFLELKHGF